MENYQTNRKGFTLLELSIVLVIVGLIIGGITIGQDLIKNAQLQSIMKEVETYKTAVDTFKVKYSSLPGDMSDATDFWGTAATCPGSNGDGTTDTTTCNGDDNGQIGTLVSHYEKYTFFKHLANAELIGGSFTGVTGPSGSDDAVIDENVPAGQYPGSGLTFRWYDGYTGDSETYTSNTVGGYGNILDYGAEQVSNTTRAALLSAQDLYNIDVKLDDGKPARGTIILRHLDTCSDDTGDNTNATADYDLSVESVSCSIIFRDLF